MHLELTSQEWAALMSAVSEQESQLEYFVAKYEECALELKVIRNVKIKLHAASSQIEMFA